MKFILSTMTTSVSYPFVDWAGSKEMKNGGPVPILRQKITIRGGAGLRSTRSGFGERSEDYDGHPIWTADGFVTPVSDENYERLKTHPIFVKHEKAGLVRLVDSSYQHDHGKIAKEARSMSKTENLLPLNAERAKLKAKVKESLQQEGTQFTL
ncbi:hypothetical protein CPT_Maja_012 [Burkholderia phage Maja]|uniref:Uncharacterized protein n=1 Tax=Burkholderia phage Maja TaxID=2767571 RepID=A0A7S6R880_9CAUD|nr:hypothetical protein CPT_Maja_012 [Burkholderia phage Maja]